MPPKSEAANPMMSTIKMAIAVAGIFASFGFFAILQVCSISFFRACSRVHFVPFFLMICY